LNVLRVGLLLNEQAGKGMAQVMEANPPKTGCVEASFKALTDRFKVRPTVWR
jgi:hypothetical protein